MSGLFQTSFVCSYCSQPVDIHDYTFEFGSYQAPTYTCSYIPHFHVPGLHSIVCGRCDRPVDTQADHSMNGVKCFIFHQCWGAPLPDVERDVRALQQLMKDV